MNEIFQNLYEMTAFSNIIAEPQFLIMYAIAFILLYLGIKKLYLFNLTHIVPFKSTCVNIYIVIRNKQENSNIEGYKAYSLAKVMYDNGIYTSIFFPIQNNRKWII